MVLYQVQYFFTMRFKIGAFQCHIAGRKVVINPVAGGADFLMCSIRGFQPLPASFVVNRMALRAYCGFGQFSGCLVSIDMLFRQRALMRDMMKSCDKFIHGVIPFVLTGLML